MSRGPRLPLLVALAAFFAFVVPRGAAFAADEPVPGSLEARLLAEGIESLARDAIAKGDPQRGAVAFHQRTLACSQCHATNGKGVPTGSVGPDLTTWPEKVTPEHLVESLLAPSRKIRKGFETAVVVKDDGRLLTGLLVEDRKDAIVLRLPRSSGGRFGATVVVPREEIEEWRRTTESLMPAGVVNQVGTRQQFLDLVAYVHAIAVGGPRVAGELQPPAALLTAQPLPEYEAHVDHATLIRGFDDQGFARGKETYERLCANCHGTHDRPGTLPTSRKFGTEPLKNGNDPHAIYQTLTHGFGMMVPQHWMVPRQKYDVVHYIREDYLKRLQPAQYFAVTDEYLASLPTGDTLGPEPSTVQEWAAMDYGDSLINTYEFGTDGSNIAYKGIAVRLDGGPGGVSRGRAWTVFEHDTLRLAGFWTGEGFIDWNGIHFNGKHGIHPRTVGTVHVENEGPGWADPATGSFDDDQRVVGRDDRRYGPLPESWGRYEGLHRFGDQAIVRYRVGETSVLEMPSLVESGEAKSPVLVRSFEIGARTRAMTLSVAMRADATLNRFDDHVTFGPRDDEVAARANVPGEAKPDEPIAFDGTTYLEVSDGRTLDTTRDFTVTARIRTKHDGTIFARTSPGPQWVPGGQVLFVRGGKLCYDVGWVGDVSSNVRVDDGKWHDVALSVTCGLGTLFVDGREVGSKSLMPKALPENPLVRIGYCAANFPNPTAFRGEIADVRYLPIALEEKDLEDVGGFDPLARWNTAEAPSAGHIPNTVGKTLAAVVRRRAAKATVKRAAEGTIVAGVSPLQAMTWKQVGDRICLVIPAGHDVLRFNVWTAAVDAADEAATIAADDQLKGTARNLGTMTNGGPPRWPQGLVTQPVVGNDDGPFAVDVLTRPAENPWFARVRLTGFDFTPDGNTAIVCAWDGDVWKVTGLLDAKPGTETPGLKWQRIASGLFQPLGVKIVDGETIYVTCRDQLVILRDRNGDGETDFYECFNSDHQVTEHFHEFAMGLQRDADGSFYYAKSARHALPAIVPHHGTLLRVGPDGRSTDILATGFRAANGVCLNPDGTFFVTDQEGHWTPKNRINWVREGGFYGNMMGYHDVADPSDDAMQQPLCWITNAFDRSPAELLWVDSEKWGPLSGRLLNLSYGYGKVYVVPHEQVEVDGETLMQGGMSPLPLPNFPTGLVRGRFHPGDGQLYTAGMFAWAGSQQQPGGFYRIRHTGTPIHLPVEFHARKGELELGFTDDLDPESATEPANYTVRVWDLNRSRNYGSKHVNERTLTIESVQRTSDGRGVILGLPDLAPTRGLSVRWDLDSGTGHEVKGELHGSIHALQ